MTSNQDGLEPYVILSYPRYKALDQRAKRGDTPAIPQTSEPAEVSESPSPTTPEPPPKEAIGTDVTLKYRTTQMKRLLQHISQAKGSEDILALPNLETLIKAAVTTSRKSLPNEKKFFTFLFENSLGAYVKNRNKINAYYQMDTPWYEV